MDQLVIYGVESQDLSSDLFKSKLKLLGLVRYNFFEAHTAQRTISMHDVGGGGVSRVVTGPRIPVSECLFIVI